MCCTLTLLSEARWLIPGSSADREHYVAFFGKTPYYSHSASLHSSVSWRVLAKTTATRRRRLVKNEFSFYLSMSQLCKSVQYTCRSKNVFRLNMNRQRSVPKEDTKISPLQFAFSKIRRTWAPSRVGTRYIPGWGGAARPLVP